MELWAFLLTKVELFVYKNNYESRCKPVSAEDVAIGFGWITVAKSGNEAVRWARVNGYLKEIGFSQDVAKDVFYQKAYSICWK